MNEDIILAIVVAAPTVFIGILTYNGNKTRFKLEEKEARTKAQTAKHELDMQLQETTDRIRRELWADVESKMEKQALEIEELRGIVEDLRTENAELRKENKILRNGGGYQRAGL